MYNKLSNCEIFDYLVDVVEGTNLMGKPYSKIQIMYMFVQLCRRSNRYTKYR